MDRAQLRENIHKEVNRPSMLSGGQVDLCIELAEAELRRVLRTRQIQLVKTATLTAGDARLSLPPDWREAAHVVLLTNPITIVPSTDITGVSNEQAQAESGRPRAFCVVGDEAWFGPVPDADYQVRMVYFAELPALSDTVTTNWLLEKHPDAYFYAALKHTAPYLHQDSRLATWQTLASDAIEQIKTEDWNARIGSKSGPLKMRSRSF